MREISLEETVKLLDKSERTIRSYIKRKKLKATKVGNKWFIEFESAQKLLGNSPEDLDKISGKPVRPSGIGVENLACFNVAMEVFSASIWVDDKNPFWSELVKLKCSFFCALGAGYYSYGTTKSRYYREARAALGSAVALVCAAGSSKYIDDLGLLEQKLIPALTSLIKKMERKTNS